VNAAPPLLVVALGGNAVSPPRGGLTFAVERRLIDQAASELALLGRRRGCSSRMAMGRRSGAC
jgi:hypothetical protein